VSKRNQIRFYTHYLGAAYGYNANPANVALSGSKRAFVTDGGLGGDSNGPLRDPQFGGDGNGPVPESAIATPSQMIAIGDSTLVATGSEGQPRDFSLLGQSVAPFFIWELIGSGAPSSGQRVSPPSPNIGPMLQRHRSRWNMVFCDSHVEHQRPEKFFNVYSDEVLSLWNRDHRPHRK
jgi:prepilin-type processing-associated H-X9-DG protein